MEEDELGEDEEGAQEIREADVETVVADYPEVVEEES